MSRVCKSLKATAVHFHREHRSKKGRRRAIPKWQKVRRYKMLKLKIKEEEKI